MKKSTSFLSLFTPSNETFMKVWELERAVQTPRVEECLHFCILVFSNTHCSISKIYNEKFISATNEIIIDNVSKHSWPWNVILTTLADNGFITCAKRSYKLAGNLGLRHWTERLKSNSVNSTSIQNILFHVATVLLNRKVTITFFFRIFSIFSVFTYLRVIVYSHRYLLNHFSRLKKIGSISKRRWYWIVKDYEFAWIILFPISFIA